ncbi:MAG: acyl carrier protein [Candidatus Omnitrophica bacterium]|nr:acyl carrier protein [Candidatus Omnitrophota bacterium]
MSRKIDLEGMKREVKKLISEIAEISQDQIKDDARFVEDLGIDSMMALEIIASIEKKYKIVIPEDKIPTINSLNAIYSLIEEISTKKK